MIEAILFCEFDNQTGPKITYQVPERFISNDVFDSIAEYVITKNFLYGRISAVTTQKGFKITGVPVCIENAKKYKHSRNALLFNICFVFAKDSTEIEVAIYEPILRKLSYIFRALEVESDFLTKSETKSKLPEIISTIFSDLNSLGECQIPVMAADDTTLTTIELRVTPKPPPPTEILDHQVPVPIRDLESLVSSDWDLTLQLIIPYIDGIAYVKKIAREANLHIDVVKKGLAHLLYYGCIAVVDIFQYANVYTTTPRIRLLADNFVMQQECIQSITLSQDRQPPKFATIFRLYCSLQYGVSMREFCRANDPNELNIDECAFITYGVVNEIIRRVHTYVWNAKVISTLPLEIANVFDGIHTYDEICTALSRSRQDIDVLLETDEQLIKFSA